MRARLSTRAMRHTLPCQSCERDALAEALAILAENETPEPYGLVNGSPTAYGSLSSYWCKPARKSLADALRAFDTLTAEELRVLQVCPNATFNGTR